MGEEVVASPSTVPWQRATSIDVVPLPKKRRRPARGVNPQTVRRHVCLWSFVPLSVPAPYGGGVRAIRPAPVDSRTTPSSPLLPVQESHSVPTFRRYAVIALPPAGRRPKRIVTISKRAVPPRPCPGYGVLLLSSARLSRSGCSCSPGGRLFGLCAKTQPLSRSSCFWRTPLPFERLLHVGADKCRASVRRTGAGGHPFGSPWCFRVRLK